MKIVSPKYEILSIPNGEDLLRAIEEVGRTCYQSHEKINRESHRSFCTRILESKHSAMLEFGQDITVRFTSNRGFLAQVTRHRLCSFAAESTKYCNYSKGKFGGEITVTGVAGNVLHPKGTPKQQIEAMDVYFKALEKCEDAYLALVKMGVPAQMAREVLPIGLKADITVKANIREWRHIFSLRIKRDAHPRMRELMIPLLKELNNKIPILFEDLYDSIKEK